MLSLLTNHAIYYISCATYWQIACKGTTLIDNLYPRSKLHDAKERDAIRCVSGLDMAASNRNECSS